MIFLNDHAVKVEHFPAGEQRINLETCGIYHTYNNDIDWYYENDSEIATLYFIAEHLKELSCELGVLYMPYCPHARMDRVKEDNEVFTLKYFANIINSIGFKQVIIEDAHSDVSVALIDRCVNVSTKQRIEEIIRKINLKEDDILFYPDNGCAKKYEGVLKHKYLVGHKHRDWKTGKIQNLEVIGNTPTELFNVLIVDDICSYGGTFLHSAKKLKELGANDIYLYVTHLEKSAFKGEMIKSGLIKKIYTTDSLISPLDIPSEYSEMIEIL